MNKKELGGYFSNRVTLINCWMSGGDKTRVVKSAERVQSTEIAAQP